MSALSPSSSSCQATRADSSTYALAPSLLGTQWDPVARTRYARSRSWWLLRGLLRLNSRGGSMTRHWPCLHPRWGRILLLWHGAGLYWGVSCFVLPVQYRGSSGPLETIIESLEFVSALPYAAVGWRLLVAICHQSRQEVVCWGNGGSCPTCHAVRDTLDPASTSGGDGGKGKGHGDKIEARLWRPSPYDNSVVLNEAESARLVV